MTTNDPKAPGSWIRVTTTYMVAGAPEQRLYAVRNGNPAEAEQLVRKFIGDLGHTELRWVKAARQETIDRLDLAPDEVWLG